MSRTSRRLALPVLAVLTVLPCATASAAPTLRVLGADAPLTTTLTAASAAKRDCVARPLTGAGVAAKPWLAPADGEAAISLKGARGDWDLAVFETTSGKLVGSSAGLGAEEVVTLTLREGASLLVQACRRTGTSRTATLTTRFTRLDLGGIKELVGKVSLLDVKLRDRASLAKLQATGLDVTHDIDANSAKVMTYGDADRDVLRKAGFTATTLVGDVLKADALTVRRDRAAAALRQAPAATALPTGRTEYRQYEDYQAELKKIVEDNPKIARAVPLENKSFQGRELTVIELARDVARKDDGRPTFILNGLHHAREWPAAESIMEFAQDLVKSDGKDPRVTKLLDEVRILIMPMTNPDGFIVSRAAPDPDPDEETDVGFVYSLATGVVILGGSLSYKRKNCNPGIPLPAFPCEFAIGTDPNRNYAESWGGAGASSNPNDQSYRGTGPFSESETQAVQELTSKVNPTSFLTIHNVAALVLRPPGLKADGFAPDEEALKALGQKMADATGYTNQYGFELYDTTGTTDDWGYSTTGGFGYTIELGPENGVFHGAYQRNVIDQYVGTETRVGKGIREAYLLAAEAARNPAYTARLAGRAPAGRTLRLSKAFETASSDVCAVAEPLPINNPLVLGEGVDPTSCLGNTGVLKTPEKLEFTTVVPANGNFEWWINPSTRPFEQKAGRREEYTLTCENGDKVEQTQKLFVARGETAQVELPCGGKLPPSTSETPTKPSTGAKARLGKVLSPVKVINRLRRAIVRIGVSGGTLTDVRVRLLPRTGTRILGEAKLKRVTKSVRVQVKLRKGVRVKVGTYRLRLTAKLSKGSPVTITRTVRIQAQKR